MTSGAQGIGADIIGATLARAGPGKGTDFAALARAFG